MNDYSFRGKIMLRTSKRSTSEWFHYSASKIIKQQSFLKGVEAYGIPSTVKSGKGKENVLVADYMIEKHCSERRSMITGPSSHNQQIERIWRDVFDQVLALYY